MIGIAERVVDDLRLLADVDLDVLSDPELDEALRELLAARRLFDAQLCRMARRWEQRGVWASDGSKSSSARMARDGHVGRGTSQRVLLRGRRLRVAELDKVLKYWRQRADAELNHDGPEPELPALTLTLTPIQGAVTIDGELDPVGGQIVANALDAIITDLALEGPLPAQRAAALVEMARRAMAMPANGRPARVLANIAVGHDAFAHLCELSNGTVIRPGHLVPYLDALDIRSILFDSATHAVATSKRRTFAGALRAVVEVRDLHCQHLSGCDEPIDGDADHILPKSMGGVTEQDNGRLLCTFHNRIEPQYARPPSATNEDDGDREFWKIIRLDFAEIAGRR
ncbi:MAG: HNH endonuclease signature motif containing protein [Ilumatobacteraceae bacterium]